MGVRGLTELFKTDDTFVLKDFRGKTIAIDAMIEIHRALLAMSNKKQLTDSLGKPTMHISVIFSLILNMYKENIKQIWVFDCSKTNIFKQQELAYRKKKRDDANAEIEKLRTENDIALTWLNNKIANEKENKKMKDNEDRIELLKKRTFTIEKYMIDDIKFILDKMNIAWIEAPENYEAEHLAACLTKKNIVDAVMSQDSDTILFGAKQLIKRDMRRKNKGKTKFYLFDLEKIKNKHKLTQDDLIKIGICLGTDFSKKIKGIGVKTVLKRYKIVDEKFKQLENTKNENDKRELLNMKNAFEYFKKECPIQINNIHNFNKIPLSENKDVEKLLDWLENEKNFRREGRERLLIKAIEERNKLK